MYKFSPALELLLSDDFYSAAVAQRLEKRVSQVGSEVPSFLMPNSTRLYENGRYNWGELCSGAKGFIKVDQLTFDVGDLSCHTGFCNAPDALLSASTKTSDCIVPIYQKSANENICLEEVAKTLDKIMKNRNASETDKEAAIWLFNNYYARLDLASLKSEWNTRSVLLSEGYVACDTQDGSFRTKYCDWDPDVAPGDVIDWSDDTDENRPCRLMSQIQAFLRNLGETECDIYYSDDRFVDVFLNDKVMNKWLLDSRALSESIVSIPEALTRATQGMYRVNSINKIGKVIYREAGVASLVADRDFLLPGQLLVVAGNRRSIGTLETFYEREAAFDMMSRLESMNTGVLRRLGNGEVITLPADHRGNFSVEYYLTQAPVLNDPQSLKMLKVNFA